MKGHETQMHASSRRTPAVVAGLIAALGLGAGAGAFAYAVAIDEPGQVVRQVTVEDSEPAARGSGVSIGDIYDRASPSVVEITASGSRALATSVEHYRSLGGRLGLTRGKPAAR